MVKNLFAVACAALVLTCGSAVWAQDPEQPVPAKEPAVGLFNPKGAPLFSVEFLAQILENAKRPGIYAAGGTLSKKGEEWKAAYSVEALTFTYLSNKLGTDPLSGIHVGIVDSSELSLSFEFHVDDALRALAQHTPGIAEVNFTIPEGFVFNLGYGTFGEADEWGKLFSDWENLDLDYGPFFKASLDL